MEKISITINGKSIDLEGNHLFEILTNFFETDKLDADIPEPYEDYEEYLSLTDFNHNKCVNKEQYDTLVKMLNNRVEWTKKHFDEIDMTDVLNNLDTKAEVIMQVLKKLDYVGASCREVQKYIVNIKNLVKNNENKN